MPSILYNVKYHPRFFGMDQQNINEVKTLKQLLKDRAVNRSKLADRMGVSRQILRDWENGRYVPTFENAVKLAAELQISLRTLAASLGYDVSAVPVLDPVPPVGHGSVIATDSQQAKEN